MIRRAEALLRSLGLTEFQLGAMQALAQTLCQLGEPAAALACMADARSLIGPGHAPAYHADRAIWHAVACVLAGQGDEAEALYQQALLQCRADGDEEFFFLVLTDLAELEPLLGHADSAALERPGRCGHLAALAQPCDGPLADQPVCRPHRPVAAGASAGRGATGAAPPGTAGRGARGSPCLCLAGRATRPLGRCGAADRRRHRFVRQAGEQRLLFEPQASAAAWACLETAAPQSQVERWRLEGEALDDISVAAIVGQPG